MNYKIFLILFFFFCTPHKMYAMKSLMMEYPITCIACSAIIPYTLHCYVKNIFLKAYKHNYFSLAHLLLRYIAFFIKKDFFHDYNVNTFLFYYSPSSIKRTFDTAFRYAYEKNDQKMAIALLNLGAKLPKVTHEEHQDPLYRSQFFNEILRHLVKTAPHEIPSHVIQYACRNGDANTIELLLPTTDPDDLRYCFGSAAEHNHIEIIKLLIDKTDINSIFKSATSILHNKDILEYTLNKYPNDNIDTRDFIIDCLVDYCTPGKTTNDIVALLLEKLDTYKTSLNYQKTNLPDVLYKALWKNNITVATLLLKHLSMKNYHYDLEPSWIKPKTSLDVINLIFNNKHTINKLTAANETFFFLAYHNKIMTNPCQINFFRDLSKEKQIAFLNEQLFHITNVKYHDNLYNSNHYAYSNDIKKIKEFIHWSISHGANMHSTNKKSERPLDYAHNDLIVLQKHLHESCYSLRLKTEICHLFFQKTSHPSDRDIYYWLHSNGLCNDIKMRIMDTYFSLPFIIERNIALPYIPNDPTRLSTEVKKNIHSKIIAQQTNLKKNNTQTGIYLCH